MASDKQAVTADLAVALEDVFSVPAEEFLRLQQGYDLAKARYAATPNPKRAARAKLLSDLPIGEMIDRRWISVENPKDIDCIDLGLSKFFRQENIEQIAELPYAAKKTNQDDELTLAQLAWLYRVQNIARDMLVATRFNPLKERAVLTQLKPLLAAPEEARHVPRILQESGIRYLIVEGLKGTKIDGVCLWLDDHSPVIAMTLRHDRMDNYWFVLRHELEHVFRGHGKTSAIIDTDIEANAPTGERAADEVVANAAAAEFCAPPLRIDSFIARKAPIFPERDFLGLAKLLGVHPCLVAGQIRFKTKRFELFSRHIVKIRSSVLQSSIVDGWGDIAPIGN
jgi:HTH-type transcriptional regulator/antitoxin HigA